MIFVRDLAEIISPSLSLLCCDVSSQLFQSVGWQVLNVCTRCLTLEVSVILVTDTRKSNHWICESAVIFLFCWIAVYFHVASSFITQPSLHSEIHTFQPRRTNQF
jgi:hypothetical protein